MSVCVLCLCSSLQEPEEGRLLGTGVMNACEAPCGCWELNSGPLCKNGSVLYQETISLAPNGFCFVLFGILSVIQQIFLEPYFWISFSSLSCRGQSGLSSSLLGMPLPPASSSLRFFFFLNLYVCLDA